MKTKYASSLFAVAFTSACASGPVTIGDEFPPQVIWGVTTFAQHVVAVPQVDGGEFPAPVIMGTTKFAETVAEVPYHGMDEFPPAVRVVRKAAFARAAGPEDSKAR